MPREAGLPLSADPGSWVVAVVGKGEGGRTLVPPPPTYLYLCAVEITQVRVRVPSWAAGTLIDVHHLKIYVHLHLPPRAVNWQLGAQ